jgi:uncharacterized protein YbjT (DUF2867 family)
VLVTGATGYIGSRLIPRLAAHGHSVRALVHAVENPPQTGQVEIVDVPSIQRW